MTEETMDALEIAPAGAVKQAARDFAAALAETAQYKAFEGALERFRQDEAALQARIDAIIARADLSRAVGGTL